MKNPYIFQQGFGHVSSVHFQALMRKNQQTITPRDNSNVQSRDQKERKLNSTNNVNSHIQIVTHGKMTESPFNKNNAATIKS